MLCLLTGLVTGLSAQNEPTGTAAPLPKLGVVIVVDQMRPDYLSRFDALYTGGFRRLLDNGAVFLNAFHDHAATETAVGHTTISTGCLPSHHGIIGNDYYDRIEKRNVYSMLDTLAPLIGEKVGKGSSPRRILMPTLGKYLKVGSPASKVYSLAIKDRSAIGMAGKQADGVYWFNRSTGKYVTSIYYADAYPTWIDSFNAARQIDSYFTTGWYKLLPDSVYSLSREDAFPHENDAVHTTFPHLFTDFSKQPDKTYYDELYATPFADEVTLALARTAIHYGELGQDTSPDLLWIGCSAADATGHTYGPFSQEMQDFYLRLDRYLGSLFLFLDSTVGRDNYIIALSSDHGALPLPEELKRRGIDAGRIHPDTVKADMIALGEKIKDRMGLLVNPIVSAGSEIMVNDLYMQSMTGGQVIADLILELKKLPYVADVYPRFGLSRDVPQNISKYWRKFRNCYHPDRGPDLFVRFKENYIISYDTTGTTHGSTYDYDCIVPIIFAGPGVSTGKHEDSIRTIDLAPTLAALMRIPIDGKMDGEIVKMALDR